MSLFVSRGFSCGSPSHSALFLVQQLTSQPLSVPQCQWDRESGRSLSGDKCSHFQTCGLHRPTLYFQTTVDVLGRGKCDVPKSFCGVVQTMLNGASFWRLRTQRSLCPSSLHRRWTERRANGRQGSLVKQKSEYEATLLVECPLTIALSSTVAIYPQMGSRTLCALCRATQWHRLALNNSTNQELHAYNI